MDDRKFIGIYSYIHAVIIFITNYFYYLRKGFMRLIVPEINNVVRLVS